MTLYYYISRGQWAQVILGNGSLLTIGEVFCPVELTERRISLSYTKSLRILKSKKCNGSDAVTKIFCDKKTNDLASPGHQLIMTSNHDIDYSG